MFQFEQDRGRNLEQFSMETGEDFVILTSDRGSSEETMALVDHGEVSSQNLEDPVLVVPLEQSESGFNLGSEAQRISYGMDELLAIRESMEVGSESLYAVLDLLAQDFYDIEVGHGTQKPRHKTIDRRQRGSKAKVLETGGSDLGSQGKGTVVDLGSNLWAQQQVGGFKYREPEVYEEDSEDEIESFQPRAFAVEGEPDFESGEPQDGWEYLRRVKWEYARCPKVKVAKIDPSKLSAEQTPYMPSIPSVSTCPPHLLPSKEWEMEFLDDFSNLRMMFIRNIQGGVKYSGPLPSIHNQTGWEMFCFGSVSTSPEEEMLSSVGDEAESAGDVTLIEGHAEIEDNDFEYLVSELNNMDLSTEDSGLHVLNESTSIDRMPSPILHEQQLLDVELQREPAKEDSDLHVVNESTSIDRMPSPTLHDEQQLLEVGFQMEPAKEGELCTKEGSKGCGITKGGNSTSELRGPKFPLLGILLKLDEVQRAALLRYHISWLERVDGLSLGRAQWLFALSIVVDKPLDAQTSATFRSLLRRCASLRASKTDVEDEELHRLNLLITIAGRYFGQSEDVLC